MKQLTIKDMQHAASKKNGTCLSEEYVNVRSKLQWKCEKGHVWNTVYNKIQQGKWCPECAIFNSKKYHDDTETHKRCTKCGEFLEKDKYFSKDKRKRDGFRTSCNECNKKKRREWRINNKFLSWSYGVIYNHIARGFRVIITPKELEKIAEEMDTCHVCDISLDYTRGKGVGVNRDHTPTLDRMNNGQRITIDNINILCHRCNRTKTDRTMKEFIKYCKMVADKFGDEYL